MRRWQSLCLVLLCTACGNNKENREQEAPKKVAQAPQLSKKIDAGLDESKKKNGYRQALREGRKLVAEKKYADAMRAYKKGLEFEPQSARIFSEIGWAAFHAGELEKAESFTKSSVSFAKDARLKAASLYNLGRIRENRGLSELAQIAYEESLALRPHTGVASRLAALTGVDEKIQIVGPLGALQEFCESEFKKSALGKSDRESKCDLRPRLQFPQAHSDWQEAFLFALRENLSAEEREGDSLARVALQLAVKKGSGWYIWVDALDTDEAKLKEVQSHGSLELEGESLVLKRDGRQYFSCHWSDEQLNCQHSVDE